MEQEIHQDTLIPSDAQGHPIILFDGVCNFCNSSVQFIIKRDKRNVFRFAPLQSDLGTHFLNKFNMNPKEYDSIVLVDADSERFYTKSSAALKITKELSGAWPILYSFVLWPKFIRDWMYGILAANRYRWFGKKDACMIPTPDVRAKFIG